MPTYTRLPRFDRDYDRLTPDEKAAFRHAIAKFVEDLDAGRGFRKSLRVKGIQGSVGVYEMTWANDRRATFAYGSTRLPGEPHIIWRRVGTHAIFGSP